MTEKLPAQQDPTASLLARYTARQASAVDQILSSLPPQILPSLRFEKAKESEADGYTRVTLCELVRRLSGREMVEAIAALEDACRPAAPEVIVGRLAELKAVTRQQRQEDGDMALSFGALTVRLRDYPAEIVLEALRSWSDHQPWFPAWADLKQLCDARMSALVEVERALRNEIGWDFIKSEAAGSDQQVEALAKRQMAADRAAGDLRAVYWLQKRLEAWQENRRAEQRVAA